MSDFLFFVSYRVVRYRRKLVQKNLKNSFPEKSAEERHLIEKEFYSNLCDYAVEVLKLFTITREELSQRMIFTDVRFAEKYRAQGQPVLVLASHIFNWEWMVSIGNVSLPMPVDFVYQPLNNSFFDRFSLECRSRFGSYPIKRDEVARETLRRKDIPRCVAIVADQYPGYKKDKKFAATFLHQETVFFYGANQLAVMTQYPVLFPKIVKVRRGYYEVSFEEIAIPPFSKDSNETVERYIEAVEKIIRKYPSMWLWSHNRWKKRHLQQAAS